eukprot:scaffold13478_cov132-Cylindrotheca_fusiformis.AAC.20
MKCQEKSSISIVDGRSLADESLPAADFLTHTTAPTKNHQHHHEVHRLQELRTPARPHEEKVHLFSNESHNDRRFHVDISPTVGLLRQNQGRRNIYLTM